MQKTRSKTNTQHTNTQLLRHFIDFENQLSKEIQGNQGDIDFTCSHGQKQFPEEVE